MTGWIATSSAALDAADARALTDQIKVGVEAAWHLITRAYTERAWAALGYPSWDDYTKREFDASRLRLPREERAEVVSSLRDSGLSLRAISSATGLGRGTVERELSPVPNGTPASPGCVGVPPGGVTGSTPGQTERVANALANAQPQPTPTPVVGLDGKTYQPKPQKPRRRPITDAFADAARDFTKASDKLSRLSSDDRFPRNRDALRSESRRLAASRDAINAVLDKLNTGDAGGAA